MCYVCGGMFTICVLCVWCLCIVCLWYLVCMCVWYVWGGILCGGCSACVWCLFGVPTCVRVVIFITICEEIGIQYDWLVGKTWGKKKDKAASALGRQERSWGCSHWAGLGKEWAPSSSVNWGILIRLRDMCVIHKSPRISGCGITKNCNRMEVSPDTKAGTKLFFQLFPGGNVESDIYGCIKL